MSKVWFVTGSSRGIGRAWAGAALERGDHVVASARNPEDVADLVERFGDHAVAVALDVTDHDAVLAAIHAARDRFGRLDVVVNNAGFGLDCVIENLDEAQARASMETNFFGALWVSQAAAQVMRPQGSGLIVQMSTQGGHMAHAGLGLYHSAKWALEGLTESLHHELAPFGVQTVLIEPGAIVTDWFGSSLMHGESDDVYEDILATRWGSFDPADMPMPRTVVDAAMQAVFGENPPQRLLLTNQAYDQVTTICRERLEGWAQWEHLARSIEAPDQPEARQ
ncbi:SDR family NAD(P)-dependent oxidoreductase [Rudaeicoccus suwonensis]|uniref:NADP-dependent 3-hydroxy acid dehydrogenase YdfG n=1 Tax=Rudaeicoccus suwonensis TaxID=657409 RepID=A0A561E9N5_9MICO|nr:SDR family NAD(P)-dependent oxidoreductase [Rudaeicoccus suwonensis]TWE12316.1 NADP-dependent 3-hydroxy acid dehydrogenase YdfG [Rudaeicoccus suwonensis]